MRDIHRGKVQTQERGDILDIDEILIELRSERAKFDKAIRALEALQASRRDPGRTKISKRQSNPRLRSIRSVAVKRDAAFTRALAEVIPIRSFGS